MTPHPLTLASIEARGPSRRKWMGVGGEWACGCWRGSDDRWHLCCYHIGYDDCAEKHVGGGDV